MEEKNNTPNISLLIVLLILLLITIIVIGFFAYKFYTEKNNEIEKSSQLQTQVNTLGETVSDLQEKINTVSETINSNSSSKNNTTSNEIKNNTSTNSKVENNTSSNLFLDGHYIISNSDVSWDFSKDGKAACSGSVSIMQGTYKSIGNNTIEIHYTKSKIWDDITGEVTSSNIDSYEYITINDNNGIYYTSPEGKKIKLERDDDIIKENFE